jgi:hypothetical protein
MSSQVTLTLPDDVFRRAEQLARGSGRPIADFLANTIEATLSPLGPPSRLFTPVSELSDQEVLATADLQLEDAQDRRLTELLDRQQAGTLDGGGRTELAALMQVYQEGLLRKSQALVEAVRRGLREPLSR